MPREAGGTGVMSRRRGHYFGTEIDGKWWKRYRRDGFFARGAGEFWLDGEALRFRRYLTKTPLVFRYADIREVRTGRWHAGQWGIGRPVVKLIWEKGGQRLSSGFLLVKSEQDAEVLLGEIRRRMVKGRPAR